MKELKQAIQNAFSEADALQQGGNAQMGQVKLKLKEAAGYFSPDLAAELHGKIGVGATTLAPTGRTSFAWKGELPGNGKGKGKKPAAAQRVVAEQPETETTQPKGTLTEEPDNSLFVKISTMKPTEIAETYAATLDDLAASVGVEKDTDWTNVKYSAEIRKAIKAKLAE